MEDPGLDNERDSITNGSNDSLPRTRADLSQASTQREEEVILEGESDEHGFRRILRNFTPSWFVVTMGTGIVSTLLYQLPYNGYWLRILADIFFVLNILIFSACTIMSCLRYAMYPILWGVLLRHPKQRLFLGTVPTGLFTLINMTVWVCVPAWGQGMATFAWVLWWMNTVVSVVICFHLTYMVVTMSKTDLSAMTPLWLLPILPAVMASASGGNIASVLTNHTHQYLLLITCYILWGISIPLALTIMILYFYRLTVHEMLDKEVIVSVFLPIGPLGLGGFSIFMFGKVALQVFTATQPLALAPNAGEMLYVFGFVVSLIMWGFGLVWFFFAVTIIIHTRRFPFNMGWWSFTFPIGVYALSTIQFGKELDSPFFKILGTIISVMVFLLWIMVAVGTVQRSITGEMFYAPCLETDMRLRELKIRRMVANNAGDKVG